MAARVAGWPTPVDGLTSLEAMAGCYCCHDATPTTPAEHPHGYGPPHERFSYGVARQNDDIKVRLLSTVQPRVSKTCLVEVSNRMGWTAAPRGDRNLHRLHRRV